MPLLKLTTTEPTIYNNIITIGGIGGLVKISILTNVYVSFIHLHKLKLHNICIFRLGISVNSIYKEAYSFVHECEYSAVEEYPYGSMVGSYPYDFLKISVLVRVVGVRSDFAIHTI